MSKLESLLDTWFTPGFREKLVSAYERIYAVNMESHNPDEGGHDSQSFGFLNWKTRCHILKQLAEPDKGILVIRRGRYFALSVGPFEVVPYNAGPATNRNYASAFPHNTKGAARAAMENIEQLRIPFGRELEEEMDDSDCRKLILADMGDSDFGCSSLFIGVPIRTAKGRIDGWSRIKVLWEKDFTMVAVPAPFSIIEKAPVETVSKPTVKLKNRDIKVNE